MSLAAIPLFVGSARISTIVLALAFVIVAAARRDHRPLLALAAWLYGFEAACSIGTAAYFRPSWVGVLGIVAMAGILAYLIGTSERGRTYALLALLLGMMITYSILNPELHISPRGTALVSMVFYAGVVVVVLPRLDLAVSRVWLAAALGVFALWLATGFDVNGHTMVGLDPTAEALNEVSKTLWALAYLIPVVGGGRSVSLAARRALSRAPRLARPGSPASPSQSPPARASSTR